jgi:hypothetical protein
LAKIQFIYSTSRSHQPVLNSLPPASDSIFRFLSLTNHVPYLLQLLYPQPNLSSSFLLPPPMTFLSPFCHRRSRATAIVGSKRRGGHSHHPPSPRGLPGDVGAHGLIGVGEHDLAGVLVLGRGARNLPMRARRLLSSIVL